ncbi:metal ABC transporter ATP-binding protein [Demetria terragena]|uniref:metal ABC transporter ATP-binding protein n=1 Tax=Demetria terragena TaxID=63959 RepID=UPI00038136A2|nr:ATP-binding cassette domain-containing protein [Demetria terragena]
MTAVDSTPVLALRSTSFGYADRKIVHDVDLTITSGEVVALLGANGSGKSTLVRGLLGLTDQLGGEARLLGSDLARLKDRHRLGYVPQRHTLSGSVSATVEEVTLVGRLPHQRWWARPRDEDRRLVREALDLVGLADRAREDVSTLSGGQQRRVLIARALAAQPEILLMDEPTAGVDEASQHVLADVLRRLAERGTTMVIVTHELAAFADVVTRIVELSGGRVHFDGVPTAYARHHHAQILGGHHHHHEDTPRSTGIVPAEGPLARGDRHV